MVNPGGGSASARGGRIADEVAGALAAVGVRSAVRLVDGCDIAAAVADVAREPLVVVGGGDGTLGCAAGALMDAGGSAALGILPLGTRNHLATDLGIPADLAGAARVIAAGHRRRIDVARVNHHHFINNASVGLYPALVQRRDELQRDRKLPKWLANLPAAWRALKRARHHRLRLVLDGDRTVVRTPLLFVGNNRYGLEPGALGRRARLDEGCLGVFAVGPRSRLGLIGLAARTLVGRSRPDEDYAAVGAVAAFTARPHGLHLDVALDGEVVRLDAPLRFESLNRALEVVAPPA